MTRRAWNTLGAFLIMGALILGLAQIVANGAWLIAILVCLAGIGCITIAETD